MVVESYSIQKVPEYVDRLKSLQHLVDITTDEHRVTRNTGTHAITATATLVGDKMPSALPWDQVIDSIDDICVLLSLFSSRCVFAADKAIVENPDHVILQDSREWPWGGTIRCSAKYETAESPQPGHKWCGDVSLEKAVGTAMKVIRRQDWRDRYDCGYPLISAYWAFQQRTINSAFVQCWTLLEMLFALDNRSWMSSDAIRKCSASEKVAFLLVRYALRSSLTDSEKRRVNELASVRNRLVHFGRLPDTERAREHAVMLIRITEWIVAAILELTPSHVFNTVDRLEEFLTSRR
ncbi:hypothetical protein Spa11_09070 [Botrimarina mediterranea]|uniref:Apea-like HEPN domain-containing protein n=2 Tax=Botrimarina mediterranea TaxID=2528022 RepID=A0A518K4N4_9BACT|nr:hypothetical protein Spa11_09070 [Botrimarina mediterranea]